MSEHTRTTRDVEFFFVAGMTTAGTRPHIARAEFRDYLAAHDAQVLAEALREAARDCRTAWLAGDHGDLAEKVADLIESTLTARADRIAQEGAGQ